MSDAANYLKEFHDTFKVFSADKPAIPHDSGLEKLRRDLLEEEVNEFIESSEERDLVNIAKELADVVYVAYGNALAYGIDLDAVLKEVHASNMTKVGLDGTVLYREDGKVLKPSHYRQPDIAKVLAVQNGDI